MKKLLFIIVLGACGYFAWKYFQNKKKEKQTEEAQKRETKASDLEKVLDAIDQVVDHYKDDDTTTEETTIPDPSKLVVNPASSEVPPAINIAERKPPAVSSATSASKNGQEISEKLASGLGAYRGTVKQTHSMVDLATVMRREKLMAEKMQVIDEINVVENKISNLRLAVGGNNSQEITLLKHQLSTLQDKLQAIKEELKTLTF